MTCEVQINYPSAEAALAGKGGTVGQLIFSFKTADIKKGQLEATVQTLADVAGERKGGNAAEEVWDVHMWPGQRSGICGRVTGQPCRVHNGAALPRAAAAALLADVPLSHVRQPASAAADEMTRKGWEAGPENDI